MAKKPDSAEPPEMKSSIQSRIKSILNGVFGKSRNAPSKKDETSYNKELPDQINKTQQHLIIKNFDSFADKTAEDVMIPRADILAVKCDISLEDLIKIIIKHAHTRTLVYKENLDNIIGFVHIKDLFEIIAKSKKFNLKKLLRKQIVATHSMKLVELLKQMQLNRTHIAVVVDEYGGTDGIVTIEDIIESIVGPIDDEHDTNLESENFKILKPGLVIANARMEVEELERILSIHLRGDDDEFDTIGGLILAKVGNVPEKGRIINITDEVTVEIIDSSPRAIKQVKIVWEKA